MSKSTFFAHISIMIHYDIITYPNRKVKHFTVKKTPKYRRFFVICYDFFVLNDKLRGFSTAFFGK